MTTLHLAVWFSPAPVVKVIAEVIPDVNVSDGQKRTPLHYAAQYNKADVVQMLINNHADVKAIDQEQVTPLVLAALVNASEDVLKVLIDADPDKNTALHIASEKNVVL